MEVHQLGLIDNALDSLEEAFAKFEQGEAGNPKAYKFAVLHMAHFVELVFKYHIARVHPLLVYRDPFAKKLDKAKTIGLWDAINFINNESTDAITAEFKADLEWIKQLRNDIEHHKFVLDVQQTRLALGRLFRSVLEFLEFFEDLKFEESLSASAMETFRVLSDEYEFARDRVPRRGVRVVSPGSVGLVLS